MIFSNQKKKKKEDKQDKDPKEVTRNELIEAWLNSLEVKQRPLEEENMVNMNELGNKDFMETCVPVFTLARKKEPEEKPQKRKIKKKDYNSLLSLSITRCFL